MKILLNCLVVFTIGFDLSAQELRIPVDFFELLPVEAHWLIEGEGIISFKYEGQYNFLTKFDEERYRSVEVNCRKGFIEISEIQNDDTLYTLFSKNGENEVLIINDKMHKKHSKIEFVGNADNGVLMYDSDTIYTFTGDKWRNRDEGKERAIFGRDRLRNSIYKGEIMDRTVSHGIFKRSVSNDKDDYIFVKERRILGFKVFNSNGYSIVKCRRKVKMKKKDYEIRLPLPPKKVNVYVCELKVEINGRKLLFKGMESSE